MKSIPRSVIVIIGLATALSSLAVPLSSVKARSTFSRPSINLSVGIAPYIGMSLVSNTANTTAGVTYENGTYSKTMQNGESISGFGTTRFRIICNFETNDDPNYYDGRNCKTNGWSLNVTPSPESIATIQGVEYAAMTTDHSDYILSNDTSMNGANSTWLLKVNPVVKTVNNKSVSANAVNGFGNLHKIYPETTSIATASSWQTINGVSTYISSYEVDVQYGISVSNYQSAGTYTGVVDYTVSLNAASP